MTRSNTFASGLAAFALACTLAFAGALACAPAKAYATLTAGDLATAQPIASIGYNFTPTVVDCYSAKARTLVMTLATDTDADFYEFWVATDAAFTKGIQMKRSTTPTVTFSGLKAGKKYYARAHTFGDRINGSSTKSSGEAFGAWVSGWTTAKKVTVCKKPGKNKIVGKWKLTGGNVSKSLIKYNNQRGYKFILTMKKNGTAVMKDYDGKKYKFKSWGVTGKKAGSVGFASTLQNKFGSKTGTVKLKGKTLTLKVGSYKMVFKRM